MISRIENQQRCENEFLLQDNQSKITKYILSSSQLIRNISRVVFASLAIYLLNQIPITQAGPVTWAACIASCETVAAGATVATGGAAAPSLMACVTACGPLLALPFCP